MIAIDCQEALNAPIMQQIYHVESSNNPYAIGVVGGRLQRQPKNINEAVATANYLRDIGRNFSIGKGQVNLVHFNRLGWSDDLTKGFDECRNVNAAYDIFKACYAQAVSRGYGTDQNTTYSATHAALSCYYSGRLESGKRVADVTRYVNAVLGVNPSSIPKVSVDNASVIPLVGQSKIRNPRATRAVAVNKPSNTESGLLFQGRSQNRSRSMMLVNQ